MLIINITVDAPNTCQAHNLIMLVTKRPEDRKRFLILLQGQGVGSHDL